MTATRRMPGRDVVGRRILAGTLVALLGCLTVAALSAEARAQAVASAGSPADVAAIRAAAAAYRTALAKGDTDAVKAAWTADGDIVDGWGRRLRPQDVGALDGGTAAAAGPRPEFRLAETQLRFVTPDVAVEDGTVDVVLPGMKNPIEGWFSALWVRTNGGWKLAGLRESERPVANEADTLEDLDWLVGDWALTVDAERGGAGGAGNAGRPPATPAASAMEMSVRWDAGRTFLIREARVPVVGDGGAAATIEVHQRIGWDPLVRRIRSWSFSSDGSRGEATWFRDGDSWVAVQTGIMPDGRQDNAVNIYSYDGRDRCVWRILPEALGADDGRPTRATWVRKPKGGGR